MTVAASFEQTRHYPLGVQGSGSTARRIAILCGLMVSDLLCFALGDVVLHMMTQPPALALFQNRTLGRPNTIIDLVMIIALVFVSARYLVGDYSRRQLFWDGARSTTTALLISGAAYSAALVALQTHGLLPGTIVWLGLIFAIPTARQITRLLLGKMGAWHLPTAIIGTSPMAQEVVPVLGQQLALGLKVKWVVPETPEKHLSSAFAGLAPLIVPPDQLTAALIAAGCRQVILVPDDRTNANQNDLIDQLVGADIAVAIVPSLRRLPLYGLSTNYFFGKDLLLLQVRNNLARLPQRIFKRSLDIIGAILLAALLAPVFAVFAFLIWTEDRGPVFFRQNRVGRWGRDFQCWKFRTMVVDAEDQMARWETENPVLLANYCESNFKLKADPRVTRIGAWMRRKSLDELPQLINVLRGNMSLVGPRPLLRRELSDYGAVISLYERVRPGITGLWQISGRSHTTFAERVSYDEWYIKNWTVWYDLVIMLQTIWVLMRGTGAY
ncbi:MAG: undecaprenyl-phosphate galactose phosphotransferase WbaP [Alphaproteobacteria bacterium]|nr:undecaprenyl-phosphate galactose phosphotransferase WbaP [Alphaproteobacteria bacterium]